MRRSACCTATSSQKIRKMPECTGGYQSPLAWVTSHHLHLWWRARWIIFWKITMPIHAILRSGWHFFHLRFESIHPFVDGNGRTGRLILNVELMRHGFPPINIRNADRNMYFYAFSTWQMKENPDHMIRVVALYLLHELRKLE